MLASIPQLPMSALLAAGGPAPFVVQIALCFVAAAGLTLLCQKLRLPSIAGFIVAGVLIGPIGLGIIEDRADIETIAGLGLVFLLFLIGLEIDVRSLIGSGRTLLVTGLLQVPASVLAAAGAFAAATVLWPVASTELGVLYLGLAAAFSSTLLVVKVLHDRLQMDSIDGRLCIGLLVFQDIWAIVILAVQPDIDDPRLGPIVGTLIGVVIVIAVAIVASRTVLPAACAFIAKSPEWVVTLALGWCFGLGMLGVGLGPAARGLHLPVEPSVSLELGALVAGASIASFPYAHEVVSKVGNLRDFFITLFFVALGMSIPIPDGPAVLLVALLLAAVTLGVRYFVFFPLLFGNGLDLRHSITTSTKLAQVSEFALVICYLGLSLGHIEPPLVSSVIFAFVLTAVLTPGLFTVADPVYRRLAPWLGRVGLRDRDRAATATADKPPPRLVFLGFHRLASTMLHDLERTHPEILPETLVVDINVALHDKIRKTGAQVVYGDISDPSLLAHAGVADAEVIVSTITDDLLRGIDNLELTRQVRQLAPRARLVVHTNRFKDVDAMYAAGADYVYSWRSETSLGLVPAVYAALNGDLEGFLVSRRLEAGERLVERAEILD